MRRWVARSDPAPAVRRWLAQVPLTAPPKPSLGDGPRDRCLRPLRPRGAGPPRAPSGGHPHGMLPLLDGHGREPQVVAVAPELRAPGPGGIGPRPPRGPRLAVRPGDPTLAVPPPPLEGGRADLQSRPPAGAPLGPGSPSRPAEPRRLPARRRGAGLDFAGVRRVVRGAARPGGTAAAPAAPPRRGRRPHSGEARGPRARGGVAGAPPAAGRVRSAPPQVCGHWAALPVRPPRPSPPPCPPSPPSPTPPQPDKQGA